VKETGIFGITTANQTNCYFVRILDGRLRMTLRVRSLASRPRQQYCVDVAVQSADHSRPSGAAELIAALDQRGLSSSIRINNAGFGLSERFIEQDLANCASMLQLNILALTELSRCYAQRMHKTGSGHIFVVASLAAYMPAPLLAAYAASKAYVLSLDERGEAIHVELAPKVGSRCDRPECTVLPKVIRRGRFGQQGGRAVKLLARSFMARQLHAEYELHLARSARTLNR